MLLSPPPCILGDVNPSNHGAGRGHLSIPLLSSTSSYLNTELPALDRRLSQPALVSRGDSRGPAQDGQKMDEKAVAAMWVRMEVRPGRLVVGTTGSQP